MFEAICIARQTQDGAGLTIDAGLLAEALVFYQKVTVVGHAEVLRQLIRICGPDTLVTLVARGTSHLPTTPCWVPSRPTMSRRLLKDTRSATWSHSDPPYKTLLPTSSWRLAASPGGRAAWRGASSSTPWSFPTTPASWTQLAGTSKNPSTSRNASATSLPALHPGTDSPRHSSLLCGRTTATTA